MRKMAAALALGLGSAVLYGGFFASLPAPLSAIHLPLIVTIAFVVTFRFPEAFAAAVSAGLTLDLLSAGVLGTNTVIMSMVTLALIPLLTHVFTNRSIPGFVGINMVAFVLLHGLRTSVRAIVFWLDAYPLDLLFGEGFMTAALSGLAVHVTAAVLLFAFTSLGRKTLGTIVMMR